MEALKILQLADHSEIISGGAMQMLLLAQGLRGLGHDVTCVFDRTPSPLEYTLERVTDSGLRLVRLPMCKKEKSEELRDLVATERFDVIHTHRATYKVLLRSCKGIELPPVVVNRGHSRPVREAERAKLAHPAVRAHVVVAAHIKDVLVAGGIPGDRVEVVYGGFDPGRFHPEVDGSALRREWQAGEPQTQLVGIVAKLSHYKSHGLFLEACARVLRARPAVRFIVVGPDPGGVRDQLQALALALDTRYGVPLSQRLLFTGPRQDIPQVLAAVDVSVSASATPYEGLSGAMRESLAMARPVVCTDVGGNGELVRDGDTGRLVPPGDIDALTAAMLELLGDPARARELGLRGLRLVQDHFSNAARARRIEHIYRRLLEEAHAAS